MMFLMMLEDGGKRISVAENETGPLASMAYPTPPTALPELRARRRREYRQGSRGRLPQRETRAAHFEPRGWHKPCRATAADSSPHRRPTTQFPCELQSIEQVEASGFLRLSHSAKYVNSKRQNTDK